MYVCAYCLQTELSMCVCVCLYIRTYAHVRMCTLIVTFLIGVNSMEILLSQIISFFLVLCLQTTVMFFMITYTFDVSPLCT